MNYFCERDMFLAGTPVNSPTDPRALFYFDEPAQRIEIRNLCPFRLFVSFDFAVEPGVVGAPGPAPQVLHEVIEPAGTPGDVRAWDDAGHARVTVWLDPAVAPAAPCPVRVTAQG